MRFPSIAALMIIQAAFVPRPATAQTVTTQVDSVMNALLALDLSPGAGIVVVRDTQIVYMKGFGYADVAAREARSAACRRYGASRMPHVKQIIPRWRRHSALSTGDGLLARHPHCRSSLLPRL